MRKLLQLILKFIRLFDLAKPKAEVDYITSGEALPAPLSPEEENEIVEKLQLGSEEARLLLIERNLRLVVYIAKRFENTGIELEDLVSVGTIGLIKAVNSFDKDKNIKLATYASRCIENEILMHLRKMVRIKAEISLEEPLNVDWDGNVLLLSDILGTESDIIYREVESSAEREMLKLTFDKLPERDRKIVALRFGLYGEEEKTQKEIAEMMGISQSYISRLEKKIVSKLKKEIAKLV
ncbi:MAG TPA: RNA polymerase sporulation sigma factor SigE [Eubacteriales bacterium]|jgi:RNA polymerase sporulation-specific sigma factor|nr:RNA polymerase sporulation sigma factor SigE [Clostridia bacterium]HRR89547.1 RNA polymerase sporulation sigma factor SigE [Eubacteriales bacterium]HRU84125.1 RNA polymerase sporulation sigma factor SigE [Eubacteriales bacterium]